MNPIKLRQLLIKLHMYGAAFMAPLFIMVAISGGLYLARVDANVVKTPLTLPASFTLDADSPTLETDVRNLLASANIDHDFEYIRNRTTSLTTRPTSRTYIKFTQEGDTWTATRETPNLQHALMELHKGHGPRIFRTYQILAAITLFFIVMGGLLIGLLAPTYRRSTLITLGAGTLAFLILGFVV